MYKIIGADGKEYGPITADQLKQWIAEGRVNAQSQVLPDGATGWKPLSEIPELAAALPVAPAPMSALQPVLAAAGDQVKGPAIGLLVTGIINILLSVTRIVLMATGIGMGMLNGGSARGGEMDKMVFAVAGTTGIVLGIVGILVGILVVYGGIKMQKLENYGLCMTATVLAIIPCTSPCCLVGIPLGIWALVVLSKAEVKSAFH